MVGEETHWSRQKRSTRSACSATKGGTHTIGSPLDTLTTNMPAIGQDSGTVYQERDILVAASDELMSSEPLYRIEKDGTETDVLVKPVRNKTSPNFRKLKDAPFVTQVGRRETNPTHDACVGMLVTQLLTSKLKIVSATFDEKGNRDANGATLFSQGKCAYEWWQDGGACRMTAELGRYIQPDICGRSKEVFFPSGRQQAIIIEVINTHPPEIDTFYALLNYSLYNHIVLFYFVADGAKGSQYSEVNLRDGCLQMRASHYLLGGCVYRNGDEVKRYGKDDEAWYRHLLQTYFGTPLRDKHA